MSTSTQGDFYDESDPLSAIHRKTNNICNRMRELANGESEDQTSSSERELLIETIRYNSNDMKRLLTVETEKIKSVTEDIPRTIELKEKEARKFSNLEASLYSIKNDLQELKTRLSNNDNIDDVIRSLRSHTVSLINQVSKLEEIEEEFMESEVVQSESRDLMKLFDSTAELYVFLEELEQIYSGNISRENIVEKTKDIHSDEDIAQELNKLEIEGFDEGVAVLGELDKIKENLKDSKQLVSSFQEYEAQINKLLEKEAEIEQGEVKEFKELAEDDQKLEQVIEEIKTEWAGEINKRYSRPLEAALKSLDIVRKLLKYMQKGETIDNQLNRVEEDLISGDATIEEYRTRIRRKWARSKRNYEKKREMNELINQAKNKLQPAELNN